MNPLKTSSSCRLLLLIAGALLVACKPGTMEVTVTDELPDIYPDYIGVTVPNNIAPLNFAMTADSIPFIRVEVSGSQGGSILSEGEYADFDIAKWQLLLAQNAGDSLMVTVTATSGEQEIQYRPFPIYVSQDSLADWGITYRRIAPGYEMYGRMGIYQRHLSTFEESVVIDNADMEGTCMNCHKSNQGQPTQRVFHARGNHGATIVSTSKGELEALVARNDSLGGTMVYPSWHPEGRYVAFSTNKTSQMFHASGKKRVEVYDSSSDVFVYDTETHTILRDTVVMRKYWAENTPVFSSDGRWLYFTTAKRQVYPTDFDKEKYSLCRISFDAATGRLGSRVDTLVNSRLTDKSVSWPNPSPDGRYLLYVQADYGYFTVWHPEADLWLLDLQTGESRCLEDVSSNRPESYPVWSHGNMGGRPQWFLFTSRRDDGLYSRLYLSSIDSQGRPSKPFMLPQQNPKRFYLLLTDSYNTPDFIVAPVPKQAEQLVGRLKSEERVPTHTTP